MSTALEAARMKAFHSLDRRQQLEAIQRLAASGKSPHSIAAATRLSLEMVLAVVRGPSQEGARAGATVGAV